MISAKPKETEKKTRIDRAGVSVKSLTATLLVTTILALAFSLFELRSAAIHAQSLYEFEQERQNCDKAIQQFMDGSDYLTKQVQQFVVKGDRGYMDSYWNEVLVEKSRDRALEAILAIDITPEERKAANAGKTESDELIKGEIWAMRIMSESVGISEEDMPEQVAACKLEPQYASLTARQKQAEAISFVFGPEYTISKNTIRGNVNAFRNEISNRYAEETLVALAKTKDTSRYMSVALAVFFSFLIITLVSFVRQVISPLIAFAAVLTKKEEGLNIALEESGAKEIRKFAKGFNTLVSQVDQNTKRLERLGYIDYLTDVPNRASITEYINRMIEAEDLPIGLMICDIDNFKRFNDTYGHVLGDQVLKQVAKAICSAQSEEAGIAGRLCGEEFIVVTREAREDDLRKTAQRILENVRRIRNVDVELEDAPDFSVTVSIGGLVWQGDARTDVIHLLSKADKALYASKETGKDRFTFFSDLK